MPLLDYNDAIRTADNASKTHLLLGNGFSIALDPKIFTYGSLYNNADFSRAPHVVKLFSSLGTNDFEVVIHHLRNAAKVVEVYRPRLTRLSQSLRQDAEVIKDALVTTVAQHHPDRPYDIDPLQYAACRAFLSRFDHIFTLNYDVLLYWALMQREVDEIELRPDDGFRHPEEDPDLPYVSWQQSQTARVHYLHGALHLFDRGSEITKYTWSKTQEAIVDQIRSALDDDKFPLFVSEGSSASKRERILHNAYLHKALRSFESCCDNSRNAIVIFGHSLHGNDDHVLRCISSGKIANLLVGIFGDPDSAGNKEIRDRANALAGVRDARQRGKYPLAVTFYDAASVKPWG